MNRRKFIKTSSCGAYVAGLFALSPAAATRAFAQSKDNVVATEKWGRIEKINDNMWAMVSTLENNDFTTVCNGGIIAGDKGVLAVETFMQPEGAKWLADWSEKLTGRWPTDIVVTHYHADHSAGARGYDKDGKSPRLWLTEQTEQLINKANRVELPDVTRLEGKDENKIDLGNRKITIRPRAGHTASDLVIEVSDPNVIWAGDLFFNRMVPNYMDALAKRLTKEVSELARETKTIYVPGHGPVADANDLKLYQELLEMLEAAATAAYKKGTPAQQAGKEFELPEKFKDWYIFAPTVMPRAFAAWYRQLESDK